MLELHEALKVMQEGEVIARLGGEDLGDDLANAVIVQGPIDQAAAEKLLGVPAGLLGDLHERMPGGTT